MRDSSQDIALDTLQLTVLRVNRPPEIRIIPDIKTAPSDSLTIDLSAYGSDPDNPQENLIWSFSVGEDASIQIELDGSLMHLLIPASTTPYSENILVNLTDGQLTSQTTLRVDVVPLRFPIVAHLPDILLEVGQPLTVDLSPYLEPDVADFTVDHDSLRTEIDLQKRTISLLAPPGFKRESTLVLRAETTRGVVGTDTYW